MTCFTIHTITCEQITEDTRDGITKAKFKKKVFNWDTPVIIHEKENEMLISSCESGIQTKVKIALLSLFMTALLHARSSCADLGHGCL